MLINRDDGDNTQQQRVSPRIEANPPPIAPAINEEWFTEAQVHPGDKAGSAHESRAAGKQVRFSFDFFVSPTATVAGTLSYHSSRHVKWVNGQQQVICNRC